LSCSRTFCRWRCHRHRTSLSENALSPDYQAGDCFREETIRLTRRGSYPLGTLRYGAHSRRSRVHVPSALQGQNYFHRNYEFVMSSWNPPLGIGLSGLFPTPTFSDTPGAYGRYQQRGQVLLRQRYSQVSGSHLRGIAKNSCHLLKVFPISAD